MVIAEIAEDVILSGPLYGILLWSAGLLPEPRIAEVSLYSTYSFPCPELRRHARSKTRIALEAPIFYALNVTIVTSLPKGRQ